MPRKVITWVDETRACLVDIGRYFRKRGNPTSVDAKDLNDYLKKRGHEDPVIGIATSRIYFQL